MPGNKSAKWWQGAGSLDFTKHPLEAKLPQTEYLWFRENLISLHSALPGQWVQVSSPLHASILISRMGLKASHPGMLWGLSVKIHQPSNVTCEKCSMCNSWYGVLSATVCHDHFHALCVLMHLIVTTSLPKGTTAFNTPIVQRRKLRHRKIKELVQGCRAYPWHGWCLNPRSLAPQNVPLTTIPCRIFCGEGVLLWFPSFWMSHSVHMEMITPSLVNFSWVLEPHGINSK